MDRFGFRAGMDIPVRGDLHPVSYGRGWQLLRSRGLASHPGVPCDPPQLGSTCHCSERLRPWHLPADEPPLPHCVPTAACGSGFDGSMAGSVAPPHTSASIVLVLDLNASRVRFYYKNRPAHAYVASTRLAARLLLSLRAVRTKLPIRLLVSGFRDAAIEARLAALGAEIVPNEGGRRAFAALGALPSWASPWAAGSFAALSALGSDSSRRLIYLDLDVVALRNIDHLALLPSLPAATFGFKCWPRPELRAALLVLSPSPAAAARAAELLRDGDGAFAYDDTGVQSVWRRLYPQVHELPAAYLALRSANMTSEWWRRVYALHDPNLLRKARRGGGLAASGVEARVRELDAAAEREMAEVEARLVPPASAGRRGASGRRRGRSLPGPRRKRRGDAHAGGL